VKRYLSAGSIEVRLLDKESIGYCVFDGRHEPPYLEFRLEQSLFEMAFMVCTRCLNKIVNGEESHDH